MANKHGHAEKKPDICKLLFVKNIDNRAYSGWTQTEIYILLRRGIPLGISHRTAEHLLRGLLLSLSRVYTTVNSLFACLWLFTLSVQCESPIALLLYSNS